MDIRNIRSCFLATLVVALAWTSTSAAESRVLGALPADVTAFIQIPSVKQFRDNFEKTPIYAMKDRPAVAKFLKDMESKLEEIRSEARKEVGVDPWELLTSIEGEAVIGLGGLDALKQALTTQLSGSGEADVTSKDVGLFLAVDAGGAKDKVRESFDALLDKGREEGARIEVEDFHGGEITSILPPEGEDADGFDGIYVAEHGSHFVLGLRRDLTEQIVVKLESGETGGLTSDENFRTTFDAAGRGGDLFMFVNIASVTGMLDESLGVSMYGFFWQKARDLLIGEAMENLGAAYFIGEDRLRSTTFVNDGGARQGILGWMDAPSIEATPPAYSLEEATVVSSGSVNFERIVGALEEVAKVFMQFQGGGDPAALFEQQFGVSLADFKRSWGTRIDTFSTGVADVEENPLGDATIVIELKDSQPLKTILDKIQQMAPGALTPEEYQGYSLLKTSPFGEHQPALALTKNSLIFGIETSNVQKVIRRLKSESSPLQSNAEFKAASSTVPNKVSFFQFQSSEYLKQMSSLYLKMFDGASDVLDSSDEDMPASFPAMLKDVVGNLGSLFKYSFTWGGWKEKGFFMEGTAPFAD